MSDVCLSPPYSLCYSFTVSASPEVCPQHFFLCRFQQMAKPNTQNLRLLGEVSRSGFHNPKWMGKWEYGCP